MLKKFKAKALFKNTNRKRTIVLTAKTEAEVARLLQQAGYIAPFEITEELPETATDAQIHYAKSLQVEFPPNPTKDDLSALISKRLDNDSDPNPELVEFALEKGLSFSTFIGKKALYNLLFNTLSREDRIAFFTFSIYRWLSEDRHGNLESHKHSDVFYDFAREQLANESFIKSLDKYAGEDLRFFGMLNFSDGGGTQGGSTNTVAYKACADFVHARFGTPKTKTTVIGEQSREKPSDKGGCMSLLLGLAMVICLLASLFE